MVKIHIIGGPGSGKTYAAKKLSKILDIKSYDLDDVVYDRQAKGYGKKNPEQLRNQRLKAILKKKSWIIEGVYFKWLMPSFKDADYIIILTPGVITRHYRITKRFLKRKIGLARTKHENIKEFVQLLKWNHGYDKDDLERLKNFLRKYENKIKYYDKADKAIEFILNNPVTKV
jgi:adenylate kinase family enzyme